MKIGILSDIHGNIAALESVLNDAEKKKVDHLFLLGDQIGYYYEAEEVFGLIEKWPHDIIAGNHERIFLDYLKANKKKRKEIDKKYGNCFMYYEGSFSQNFINKIRMLPIEKRIQMDNISFLLCHGSPSQADYYLYPDSEIAVLRKNEMKDFNFIFNGHTHYPMIYSGKSCLLINVGSVGQSRTVGGIANWGLLNTNNAVYTPQFTPYDINQTKLFLESHKESNEYLFNVLSRNNIVYES